MVKIAGFESWFKNFVGSIVEYFGNLDAVSLVVHIVLIILIYSLIEFLSSGKNYFQKKEAFYEEKINQMNDKKKYLKH